MKTIRTNAADKTTPAHQPQSCPLPVPGENAGLERALSEFVHDVRAPLAAASGLVATLKRDVDTLATGLDEVNDYVSHDPTFGMRGFGKLTWINVESEVMRIVANSPSFRSCKINIIRPLATPLVQRVGFARALANLLANAVKFVKAGTVPSITIGTKVNGARVRV